MEERKYWNPEMESILGTPEMREIQWAKLKKQLKFVYESCDYHKKRFDRLGIKPEDVRSSEDFSKGVPIFDKDDWRKSQEESMRKYGHALGVHLCMPLDKVALLSATSGTTGLPTFYIFSKDDVEESGGMAYGIRGLWRIGVRPGDRVALAFGLSMFIGGVPMVHAIERIGACCVPVGAEAGTERVLMFTKLTGAKCLICTPSFATYMIEKAPEVTGTEVKELGIKILLCGGEPGAGIPDVRERLETAYGAKVFDVQAGFSCDYPIYQGMHIIDDDVTYWELVDPETKEPIKWENGAIGENITTTLEPTVAPFVRYSPGDVIQIFTDPCPCGMTGFRYKIVGRTDYMLKVKGVMVYPVAVKDVIAGFVPRLTGEFLIVLDEPPPRVVPPLKLKVEYGKDIKEDELDALNNEVCEKMHKTLKITPKIEWLPPTTLPGAIHKAQLLEKKYER